MGSLAVTALGYLATCLAAPAEWSPALLQDAAAWGERMNGALVTADGQGLRVEIAPGASWAIAAIPAALLPEDTGTIVVRAAGLGGGARWLMRIYGDVRGPGVVRTTSFAEQETRTDEMRLTPDPRVFRLAHRPPLQIQLGLEGAPGDWVRFDRLEFLPGPPPPEPIRVAGQRSIPTVDLMPEIPQPYKMLDWEAKARAYDRVVFDPGLTGDFLPLPWIQPESVNTGLPTFGLPSYVGDERERGGGQESITCMGAVLGATVAGIDKRAQAHDYVLMCEAFYNRKNGLDLVLNNQDQGTGGSFWYELFPHIVFTGLADRYPGTGEMDAIVLRTADRWAEAVEAMDGNLDHTAYDFAKGLPVDNGQWKEPDAAGAIAWLQYAAWQRSRDPRHLETARRCLRFLEAYPRNPYYENLLPWGTIAAARMNAEQGDAWQVDRLLEWCFDVSDVRGGWAVSVQNWGGYDCAGLLASVDNRGGYAFAMNTFTQAGALVPLARYDTRYARAIGKWMLNLANAARLFYPTELPAANQCCGWWKGDPEGVIAYEGLRREWQGMSPCGTGDPVFMQWGPKTDLGLYGSGYVGLLGGIVRTTDQDAILRLDCLATDFCRQPAYPTYLYHNPHPDAREVTVHVGAEPRDLYDAVTHRYLAKGVTGVTRVTIPSQRPVVLVHVPAGAAITFEGRKTLANGVVIDYATGEWLR